LVNVGEDATLGNGDVAQQLVQLLIVPDGELEMTGNDTRLLVVTSSIASQLKNFSGEVLEDGSQVDGSTGTDTLSIVALSQKTVDTANGERETGLGRTAKRYGQHAEQGEQVLRRCRLPVTYDCAFLEPEALPPDLPPPVILNVVLEFGELGTFENVREYG